MHQMREQLLLGGAAAVIVALFVWLVGLPREERLAQAQGAFTDLQAEVAQRETQSDVALVAVGRIRAAWQELQVLTQQVPASDELGGFLEDLEQLAAQAGLREQNVTPQPTRAAAGIGVVTLEVAFESNFRALFTFLEQLESLERLVRVTALSTQRQGEDSPVLATELTLEIYFDADQLSPGETKLGG